MIAVVQEVVIARMVQPGRSAEGIEKMVEDGEVGMKQVGMKLTEVGLAWEQYRYESRWSRRTPRGPGSQQEMGPHQMGRRRLRAEPSETCVEY